MGNDFVFDMNKELNPIGFRLWHTMKDETLRYIVLQGGSSSGKSYSFAQVCLWTTLQDLKNTLVLRKIGASISKTIFEDFRRNASRINAIFGQQMFKITQNKITSIHGAKIDFTGLDDSEKIKGISNYKRIFMDELTEFDYQDWQQIRTRMRGVKGQQLYAAFNPISEQHWVKTKIYDTEKWNPYKHMMRDAFGKVIRNKKYALKAEYVNDEKKVINPKDGSIDTIAPNFLWIVSTYLNNFWVVGSPDGNYGYYDVQCIANYEHDKSSDPDYYRVYALGEWGVIRTGGEFLPAFNLSLTKKIVPDKSLPIHVSVDDNVLPYITTTLWQFNIEAKKVMQIANVCAREPNNTAGKASKIVCSYLRSIRYNGDVFLHGDVTTKKANTIDENRRSFFDIYKTGIETDYKVIDCTGNTNPSVSLSGEFANAIMAGETDITIEIDTDCHESIDDYLSTKKDANGGILKVRVKDNVTKQSYEEHGHCTDTMRYLLVDVLKKEYTEWSLRRKHNTHTELNYIQTYEAETYFTFVVPSFDEMAAIVVIAQVGNKYVVESAKISQTISNDNISSMHKGNVFYECDKAYIQQGRMLREKVTDEVRILSSKPNADERIKATADFVKHNIYFVTDKSEDYLFFTDRFLDYNGNDCREAANIIAMASVYFMRIDN